VRFAGPGDRWARGAAIEVLGRMGRKKPEYRDAVLPYLDDPERTIRHAAASALGALGDPDVIPALCDHFRTETWAGTRDALRNAVKACRKQAVEEGRLVTVEAVRAAGLRDRHAAARDEVEALGKSKAGLADAAKAEVDARIKPLKDEMARIEKDLGALGVPVKEKPKPPAPAAPPLPAAK
jgi:HEAT repeat protein